MDETYDPTTLRVNITQCDRNIGIIQGALTNELNQKAVLQAYLSKADPSVGDHDAIRRDITRLDESIQVFQDEITSELNRKAELQEFLRTAEQE